MPLDPDGNVAAVGATEFYDYSGENDNYFYAWVTVDPETHQGTVGAPDPKKSPSALADQFFDLDNEGGNKSSYKATEVGVLFSKEKYPADNGGDMNWDGIPDIYMMKVWRGAGVSLLELVYGDAVGNVADLKDLAKTNPDEDYLPGVWRVEGEMALVHASEKSYAPIGHAFTTVRERRAIL